MKFDKIKTLKVLEFNTSYCLILMVSSKNLLHIDTPDCTTPPAHGRDWGCRVYGLVYMSWRLYVASCRMIMIYFVGLYESVVSPSISPYPVHFVHVAATACTWIPRRLRHDRTLPSGIRPLSVIFKLHKHLLFDNFLFFSPRCSNSSVCGN